MCSGSLRVVLPKLASSINCDAAAMETRHLDERQFAAPRVSTVEVTRQPGEPLGVMPGQGLHIVHVQEQSAAARHNLQPGDRIVSVNGRLVRDDAALRRALEAGSAAAQRDGRSFVTVIGLQRAAPAQVLSIVPIAAPSLGLQIRDWRGGVQVVRTERGSLAEARLQPCDTLVAVDGAPVSDKQLARQLLLRALASCGRLLLLVERPVTPDAYARVMQVVSPRPDGSPEKKAPSVNLPSDVREIGQRAVAQLQASAAPPPILKPDPDTPSKNVNADRRNIQVAQNENKRRSWPQ